MKAIRKKSHKKSVNKKKISETKPCAQETDHTQPLGTTTEAFPIVGIGASAGGLESIEKFFKHVPKSPGMAFVIIQHLSPDFKSFMPEILAKKTNLEIFTAMDRMPLQKDSIYLLPPKKNLALEDNRFVLSDIERTPVPNKPIDLFFHSLARNVGKHAIAIVLSGTGSDGALGIQAVHDAGGKVFVESISSAKFDGMPNAAIATNIYDGVGAPAEIVSQIFGHTVIMKTQGFIDFKEELGNSTERLSIFRLIESKYGVDFSRYKIATVDRRIDKRLSELDLVNIDAYWHFIQDNVEEVSTLYYEMLIGVTEFFRDMEAFNIIAQQIEQIIERKTDGDEIRIWSSGCASGEEIYSLTMILLEKIKQLNKRLSVKVFATDIDDEILARAANGVYKDTQVKKIPVQLLEKYFIKNNDEYKIQVEVRSKIVFARHNVMNDPPFTKLDLISCRNLLIYLDNPTQKQVLSLFYFSLNPDGILFLGPSESLGKYEAGYSAVDSKWKVFSKTSQVPTLPALLNKKNLKDRDFPVLVHAKPRQIHQHTQKLSFDYNEAYHLLLEKYVPPSILTDDALNIIHVYGTLPFKLELRPGKMSNNLNSFLDEGLCTAISVCVQRAKREKIAVEYSRYTVKVGKKKKHYDFTVVPILNKKNKFISFFLISLCDADQAFGDKTKRVVVEKSVDLEQISILEEELQNTKENLQATIEELETTNEELQSTNEELLASNEELQSTNEELHSVNEELYTVNAEYQSKIAELNQLSLDEQNLFKSTGVGTVFVDQDMTIRKFTPMATQSFNLLEQDIGRPFEHVTHSFIDADFCVAITQVLTTGKELEIELQAKDNTFFLVKFYPYLDAQNHIQGVVISFINIDAIKIANNELERQNKILHFVTEETNDGWWDWKIQEDYEYMSPNFWHTLGIDPTTKKHSPAEWQDLIHPDDLVLALKNLEKHKRTKGQAPYHQEVRYRHKNGHWATVLCRGKVIEWDQHGEPVRMVGVHTDITVLKEKERQLHSANDEMENIMRRYALALDASHVGVWEWCFANDALVWDKQMYALYKLRSVSFDGTFAAWMQMIHLDDRKDYVHTMHTARAQEHKLDTEFRIVWSNGAVRTMRALAEVVTDANGKPVKMVGVNWDITSVKEHEQALGELNTQLKNSNHDLERFAYITSHDLKAPLRGIASIKQFLLDDLEDFFNTNDASVPNVKKNLERLGRQVRRMEELIKGIFAYSCLEQSTSTIKAVSIKSMLENIATDQQLALGEHLIIPEHLPHIVTDEIKLGQVFSNLISNAIKYHHQQDIAQIVISYAEQGEFAEFSVKDNGPGIAAKYHEKIFEMFQTLQSRDTIESTGIGLTLVKKIVETFGGKVGVASELGHGSCFTFTWPLRLEDSSPISHAM